MYKKLYYAGLFVYVVLMILAVIFYKERIVFLDAAFAVFHIVKDGDFAIQIFRFGDGIARILPLAAYHTHQPLPIISLMYSVGFILVYIIPYVVCGTFLKQHKLALVILLVNILFVSHSFYWPTAQLPQAIALTMILLAILWDRTIENLGIGRLSVSLLLLITIVFFHPLMVLCFLYMTAFFILRGEEGIGKKVLYGIGAAFIVILVIKAAFFRAEYERHSLSGLKNFIKLFPNYFDTYANRTFLANMASKYYWIAIISVWVSVQYIKDRNYKQVALFLGVIVGYIALVNTSYPTAETPPYYIEVLYLPLGFFLALPLVFDVLPGLKRQHAIILMGLIMATGCYRIFACHVPYTERLNWERAFLKKHGHKKMIVGSAQMDVAQLQMLWGTPYEFWLLSTMEQGYSASIIIDDTPSERMWAADKNKELIVNWNHFRYEDLDPRYFHFADAVTGYRIDPELDD